MPEIVVDGQAAIVPDGVTVAAALIADGTRSWRTTRIAGKPRGVFCGMGVCFDCLVIAEWRTQCARLHHRCRTR